MGEGGEIAVDAYEPQLEWAPNGPDSGGSDSHKYSSSQDSDGGGRCDTGVGSTAHVAVTCVLALSVHTFQLLQPELSQTAPLNNQGEP